MSEREVEVGRTQKGQSSGFAPLEFSPEERAQAAARDAAGKEEAEQALAAYEQAPATQVLAAVHRQRLRMEAPDRLRAADAKAEEAKRSADGQAGVEREQRRASNADQLAQLVVHLRAASAEVLATLEREAREARIAGQLTAEGTQAILAAVERGVTSALLSCTTDEAARRSKGPETRGMRIVKGARAIGAEAKPKHHVFPKEMRAWFEERGFTGKNDIDNFCVEMERAEHEALHGGGDWTLGRRVWPNEWNQRVMSRLLEVESSMGRKMHFEEIKAVVETIMEQYEIEAEYVRYR